MQRDEKAKLARAHHLVQSHLMQKRVPPHDSSTTYLITIQEAVARIVVFAPPFIVPAAVARIIILISVVIVAPVPALVTVQIDAFAD